MKILTVRLPDGLLADIEGESLERRLPKADIVRERLQEPRQRRPTAKLAAIAAVIGSVTGLPANLSTRRKHYLRASGYGKKRPR